MKHLLSEKTNPVKNRNFNPTFPVMSFCLTSWPHVVVVSWPSGHCTQTIKYPSVFQELPKYLRGYHNVTKEDMVNIAALLFRIKVGNDNSQFVMIPRMLKELVPADHLRALSENEWRKVRRVWFYPKSSVSCCVASEPDGATAPTLGRSCLWGRVMMPPLARLLLPANSHLCSVPVPYLSQSPLVSVPTGMFEIQIPLSPTCISIFSLSCLSGK